MKDASGNILKAGDIVAIPAKIIRLHDEEGQTTLQIRTLAPRSDGILDTIGSIDAAVVFRANTGDSGQAFCDLLGTHQESTPKAAEAEAEDGPEDEDENDDPAEKVPSPVGGDVAGEQPEEHDDNDHEDHGGTPHDADAEPAI